MNCQAQLNQKKGNDQYQLVDAVKVRFYSKNIHTFTFDLKTRASHLFTLSRTWALRVNGLSDLAFCFT